jgi:hypothetical protein
VSREAKEKGNSREEGTQRVQNRRQGKVRLVSAVEERRSMQDVQKWQVRTDTDMKPMGAMNKLESVAKVNK